MEIIEAIILGAVQGVTEFLPISSTAHLILVPWFMGWETHGLTFDVALHLGTLIALLIYFRSDWISLARSSVRLIRGSASADPNTRMVLFIAGATVPAAVAGVLLEDVVERTLRSPVVISFALIGIALVLVVAEMKGRRKKTIADISWFDAMAVGVAQAIALIPGVSRSGVTITAGLFCGMKRDAAARFSFFLSTPIIGGAVSKKLIDMFAAGVTSQEAIPLVFGILTAAIVGYASIAFMLRYLQTRTTFIFVYYRIVLGIVVYLAFWSGIR